MTCYMLTDRLGGFFRTAILTSALLAATAVNAQTTAADAGVTARNETIVRQAFDKWVTGGNVFEILAPNVVWTIHGSGPVADTYNSVDDFIQRGATPLTSRLASPLVPEVHNIWAVGDTVIIRFDASSTTTSGNPYESQFVWIFHMRGVVTEAEAFLDLVKYQEVVDNNEPKQD